MRIDFSRLAILLAVSSALLSAGDTSWAFQVGAMAPQGALKSDGQVGTRRSLGGPALGFLVEHRFQGRDSVRLRLSLAAPGEGDRTPAGAGGASAEADWRIPEAGLDWRHQWTGTSRGWYSVAGVGLASPKVDRTVHWPLTPGGPVVGSTTRFSQNHRPAFRLGGGWQFTRRFSVEAAYHWVEVDADPREGFGVGRLAWIEVAAGIHFGRGR